MSDFDLRSSAKQYVEGGGKDDKLRTKIKGHLESSGHDAKTIERAMGHLAAGVKEQTQFDKAQNTSSGARLGVLNLISKNTHSVHLDNFHKELESRTESVQIIEGTAPKHKYVLDFERSHPLAKENTLETHSYIGDHGPEDMHVFDEQDKGNRIRHIIIHQKSRNRIYHQKITFKSGERFGRVSNEYYHAKTGEKLMESAADSMKHRIGVTVSDPNHEMASKRKEKFYKIVRVKAESEDEAKKKATEFYKGKGYKVHEAIYLNQINEDLSGEIEMNENEIVEEYCEESNNIIEEGYSLRKTKSGKETDSSDDGDITTTETHYDIIHNETGKKVGTAKHSKNDKFGSNGLEVTMNDGTSRTIPVGDRDDPQSAFNRFAQNPKTSSKYKQIPESNNNTFTSVDFINLLMEGKHLEAEQMFKTMVESATAEKVEELAQEVAESMNVVAKQE